MTISIVLGSGCATSRSASLATTIETFYRAEQARDWETMWSLCASTFKQYATKKEFIEECQKGAESFRIISWKIVRITDMKGPLSDFGPKTTRAVEVPMDVTIYDKSTGKTEKSTDQTDYWIQEDGKWLWHWRGFPAD